MPRPLSPASKAKFLSDHDFDLLGKLHLHIICVGEFEMNDDFNLKIKNRDSVLQGLQQILAENYQLPDQAENLLKSFEKYLRNTERDFQKIDEFKAKLASIKTQPRVSPKTSSFFTLSVHRKAEPAHRLIMDGKDNDIIGIMNCFTVPLYIESILGKIFESCGDHLESLPTKLSIASSKEAFFLRDKAIAVGNKIYFVDHRLYCSEDLAPTSWVGFKFGSKTYDHERYVADVIETYKAVDNDLSSAGIKVEEVRIPFILDGGEFIFLDKKNPPQILISMNEIHFSQTRPFFEYVDSNGGLQRTENYDEAYLIIKDFFQKLGYQDIEIIEKNRSGKYQHEEIYHLDVFMNALWSEKEQKYYLVLPKEDLITEKSRQSLQEKFGPENIVLMTKKERLENCSNFIKVSGTDNVIMTRSSTPRTFTANLELRGFNAIVPPMSLDYGDDNGLRCITLEVADKSVKKPFEVHFPHVSVRTLEADRVIIESQSLPKK